MRLTKNNILFVRELVKDGITYEWFVCMKSRKVSESRVFANCDESGKTIVKTYEKEKLPKSVQKFLEESFCDFEKKEDDYITFIHYM